MSHDGPHFFVRLKDFEQQDDQLSTLMNFIFTLVIPPRSVGSQMAFNITHLSTRESRSLLSMLDLRADLSMANSSKQIEVWGLGTSMMV